MLTYKDHSEQVQFTVTGLRKQDVILGYTWLKERNPEVNWITKEVKMSCCPGCCSTCRMEIKQECHQHQIEAHHLCICHAGPMPTVEEVFEDTPELYPDTEDDSNDNGDDSDNAEAPDEIDEGDRISMTMVYDKAEFIQANATALQCLSQAFTKNSAPPKLFQDSVPKAFHDFEDIFSKESFDDLPERKPWDHAIELELDAKVSSTKVYPLSPKCHFLEGAHHKFEIQTDHKNLEHSMTAKKLNCCQAYWSLYLSRFNFNMHHCPGCSMGKSNTPPCRVDHGMGGGDNNNIILLHLEFFAAHAVHSLSGSSLEGNKQDTLWDIQNANHAGKQENAVTKAAGELQKSKGKSVRVSEWSEHDGLLCFRDCIYMPNDLELHFCITSQHHDTKVARHPGQKTLELVSWNYWWPQMSRYICQYTRTCDLCLWTKIQCHHPIRAPPTSNTRELLGCHQCGLHQRTP